MEKEITERVRTYQDTIKDYIINKYPTVKCYTENNVYLVFEHENVYDKKNHKIRLEIVSEKDYISYKLQPIGSEKVLISSTIRNTIDNISTFFVKRCYRVV
jgi:hypothetical protein